MRLAFRALLVSSMLSLPAAALAGNLPSVEVLIAKMAISENGLPCKGYHDGGKIKCPSTAAVHAGVHSWVNDVLAFVLP